MKKKSLLVGTVVATGLVAVCTEAAMSAQDRYTLKVPNGLAFSEFKGYETWQVIAVSNGGLLAVIVGNPAMIAAYKDGTPANGKPFPDGARMAKIHWVAQKADAVPGQPLMPTTLHDVDFMVKDGKRFADSGGWGYAEFEYDAAVGYLPAGHDDRPAAAGERCQVRVRVPHGCQESGLRVHQLSQEVNGSHAPCTCGDPAAHLTMDPAVAAGACTSSLLKRAIRCTIHR